MQLLELFFPSVKIAMFIRSNTDLWTTATHALLRVKKSSAESYSIFHQTASALLLNQKPIIILQKTLKMYCN